MNTNAQESPAAFPGFDACGATVFPLEHPSSVTCACRFIREQLYQVMSPKENCNEKCSELKEMVDGCVYSGACCDSRDCPGGHREYLRYRCRHFRCRCTGREIHRSE